MRSDPAGLPGMVALGRTVAEALDIPRDVASPARGAMGRRASENL